MTHEAIQYLPLERITMLPQVRQQIDEELLHGFAQTILEVGMQAPIRVRRDGDKLVIVDGHRRYLATKLAGLASIATIIESRPLCPAEVTQRQLIANCHRKNLSSLEIALAIEELMQETKWTASETAAKLGLSNGSVSRLRTLLSLPAAIREQVACGKISPSTAYEISRVADAGKQAELAEKAASGELTREGLVLERRRPNGARKARKSRPQQRVTAVLGHGRAVTISGPTLDLVSLATWLEELLAKIREAVPQNIPLPSFLKLLKDQSQAQV